MACRKENAIQQKGQRMAETKYTQEHEWIRIESSPGADILTGVVGVTDYAQEQLGDVVFVELPQIGITISRDDEVCVIESVKAASELYAPVSGEITAINDRLAKEPELINSDPVGKGWFIKIQLSEPKELDGLMDQVAYQAFISDLD